MRWTAAELAEMEKADAALEAAPMTPEEWKESIARDRAAVRKSDKVAEYRHQYYLRTGK